MLKIVADSKIPFLENVFSSNVEMVFLPGNQISKNDLLDADAIITRSITKCDASLLENTKVRFIATATIGDDHIDEGFCEKNSIKWASAGGCNSGAVEQYVLAALLSFAKNSNMSSLSGLCIGIIGVGNIGSRIEKVAKVLGMKVLLNDPPRAEKEGNQNFTSLDELLKKADIVTMHVPLILEGKYKTFHLVDKPFFEKAEKSLMFINSSRGGIVDTEALKNAIQSSKVKFSVIDVWENEPNIDSGLLKMTDIATPHIAGYSIEGKANGTAMSVNAISRFFDLGLDKWSPEIGKPGQNTVFVDCYGKNDLEVISEIVNVTYDIEKDDRGLRASFKQFESIRGKYSFRYEPGAFSVELKNSNEVLIDQINKLGFKTINK
ncbi:MAG: erythronate-4-phosphate dehydrogenase [Bacteroidetes bacterium]|nr:MAG: erythronate-4-phosphate dehydrogenase [Bacteroidota bacterium]